MTKMISKVTKQCISHRFKRKNDKMRFELFKKMSLNVVVLMKNKCMIFLRKSRQTEFQYCHNSLSKCVLYEHGHVRIKIYIFLTKTCTEHARVHEGKTIF